MTSRRDELERFKTQIDLREYAASVGYAQDRRSSCRTSTALRNKAGDKIIVARDAGGHYVYFSVRDPEDNGSIIDFVQRRGGGSLGEVRKTLRPWIGSGPLPSSLPTAPASFAHALVPTTRDVGRVRARLAAMRSVAELPGGHHPYLVEVRLLPPPLLSHSRFASRVFIDDRGNAVFPHFDRASGGVCGYEVKGRGFSGFAPGGAKGLWASVPDSGDTRLVIAESAIDALSWVALHPEALNTRFVSTGGALSPAQPSLLTAAMQKLPAGGRVVLAVDNDAGGDRLVEQIGEAFRVAERADLELIADVPPTRDCDWNDVLRRRGQAVAAGVASSDS
ncbi:MAG: DUF3991 domain-containing protein [Dehalococcoidia bacterium]